MSVNVYNSATGELKKTAGRTADSITQNDVMSLEEIKEAQTFSPKDVPSAQAVQELNSNLTQKYSTERVVCGTWLGKPLYRKIFAINTGQANNEHIIVNHVDDNVDQVVNIHGWIDQTGYNYMPLPLFHSVQVAVAIYYQYYNNQSVIYANVTGTNYANKDGYIVVEYTLK